jgi:hypothetical protein
MSRHAARSLALVVCLSLSAILLTGCFLRGMFGNTIIVEDIENEVNEIITTVFSDSTAAVCLGTDFGFYECTYIVDGDIITSTLYLLSEFGLTGVLIDPVILQVPDNAISITATFTPSGGSAQPAVTSVRHTFEMLPHQPITAEAGTQFLIMEFPNSVVSTITATNPISGPHFDFALSFAQRQPISLTVEPVSVKAMLTAKVVSRGHTYYAPLFPCVTSFTAIPSVTIPITTTPVNLQTAIGDVIRLGQALPCDHTAYDYSNTPPPDHFVYLPLVLK